MKVRFELNIDEIVEVSCFPTCSDEKFKGEDARGKTFLFVEKMTGNMQAICCVSPITGTEKYATLNIIFFPAEVEIITEEDNADATNNEVMAHIQDCCDKIRDCVVNCQDEINSFIGKEFDELKAEGLNTGSGISEKTLLSALDIVTKK